MSHDLGPRYQETFQALRAGRPFGTSSDALRFAAAVLAPIESPPADVFFPAARALSKEANWFHPLRSSLRFPLVALCLRHAIDPQELLPAAISFRDLLGRLRLPRRQTWETVCGALLLVHPERPADFPERLASHYRAWRRKHPILNGPQCYPRVVLHALHTQDAKARTERIEQFVTALRARGLRGMTDRLVAAQTLSLVPNAEPEPTATRLEALTHLARKNGLRTHHPLTAFAPAALLPILVEAIAERLESLHRFVRAQRHRPSRSVATLLAISLAMEEALEALPASELPPAELLILPTLQNLVMAQQAAAAAAAGGAGAAAASS